MEDRLKGIVQDFLSTKSRITFLCRAGIFAESNIPKFRGPEGYWRIESKNYHPQEMATYRLQKIVLKELGKFMAIFFSCAVFGM
jgi:NAD-dependent deacetylase